MRSTKRDTLFYANVGQLAIYISIILVGVIIARCDAAQKRSSAESCINSGGQWVQSSTHHFYCHKEK